MENGTCPRKETPPVVCFVGASKAGKTTLLEELIPELRGRGLKVGSIKHVHEFQMDIKGKDSWRHKQAGASMTVIASPSRVGIVADVDHEWNPSELASLFTDYDIVLAEGFKREGINKVEVLGPGERSTLLPKEDPNVLAVVGDDTPDIGVPWFSREDVDKLADFLIDRLPLAPSVAERTRQTGP